MAETEETIFTKILNREIPADIVYEDDDTIAFLDINPVNPGHVLVIPKKYARNILDIDEESWLATMRTVRKLAKVIKEVTGADGINIDINNEPAAGQVVFHSHVHIVPRFEGDTTRVTRPQNSYGPGEAEVMAQKIREKLT